MLAITAVALIFFLLPIIDVRISCSVLHASDIHPPVCKDSLLKKTRSELKRIQIALRYCIKNKNG
jgi:hypothetical protein